MNDQNEKKRTKDTTSSFPLSRKILSIALAVVLLGFGWPAVNPLEILAADPDAAQSQSKAASQSPSNASSGAASGTSDQAASVAAVQKPAVETGAVSTTDAAGQQANAANASSANGASSNGAQAEAQAATDGGSAAATASDNDWATIKLQFQNASILPDGSTAAVGAPASQLAIPHKTYKFTVVSDNGYTVNKVTFAGKELSAGANGVYVIDGADIADGATLSVAAVVDEAQQNEVKPAVSTSIEGTDDDSNATSSDIAPQAATDASASTVDGSNADYTVKIGKSIEIRGADSNRWDWDSYHDWSVTSGAVYADISNDSSQTVVVVGKRAGTVVLTHKYYDRNWSLKSESFTVKVTNPDPVTELTLRGKDTVAQFDTVTLETNAAADVIWSTDNASVATVDGSGNVTGVAAGEATITAQVTGANGKLLVASKKITVTKASDKDAIDAWAFFVKSPTTNAASNDASDWNPSGGSHKIAVKINVKGASWSGINTYDNVANRVVSWNSVDVESDGTLKFGTEYWNAVFDAFKSEVGDIDKDDVAYIKLVPHKISNNEGDYHLDCTVEIVAKRVMTATFKLWDAGSTGYEWFDAQNYRLTDGQANVEETENVKALPETKELDGKTYKLFKWYADEGMTHSVAFPRTETGNVTYYAKYLSTSNTCTVNYYLKGTTTKVADSKILNNLTAGQTVTENAPSIDGYTHAADDDATKSIEVSEDGNEINFYYTQDNFSYTVNYVWNGTNEGDEGHIIKTSAPVTVKAGDKVSFSDDQLKIDGYTLVPDQTTTYTIDANNKIIEFKYYKNVDLAANSKTDCVYNGSDQKVEGFTGAPEGVTFEGVTASRTEKDAGTYDVGFAKASNGNTITDAEKITGTASADGKYIIAQLTPGTLKIDQRPVTVAAKPASKTYGEDDPAFTADVSGLVEADQGKASDLIKYAVSRANDAEGVGTYEGVIVPEGEQSQGNYEVSYAPADFTITAKAIAFAVESPADVEYNGAEQKQAPVVKDGGKVLTEGVDYELSYSDDLTNVGSVKITVTGKGGYEGSKSEASYRITPAPVTVTAKPAGKFYGDADPTDLEAVVSGLVDADKGKASDLIKYTVALGEHGEDVGTYEGAVKASGDADQGNYTVTYVPADFTISKKEAGAYEASVSIDGWTYDGQFDAKGTLRSAADTEALGAKVAYAYYKDGERLAAAPVDAGDYTVVASWAGTGNYPELTAEAKFTIAKRPIELTAKSDEKPYDGSALTRNDKSDYTVTKGSFVEGEGLTGATIVGSQLYVGESDNVITDVAANAETKLSNYAIMYMPGTLKVTDSADSSKVVAKTHEAGAYKSGDTVEFTLTAKNIYDEAKTMTFAEQEGVIITGKSVFEDVQPGAEVSTTAEYTITDADVIAGGFVNTAIVTFSGTGKSFEGSDKVETPALNITLNVSKKAVSPGSGSYKLGDTVKYYVTITNTGNITYTNVAVNDAQTGLSETIAKLAPNESVKLNTSHVITESDIVNGKYDNTATAQADSIKNASGETVGTPKGEDIETIGTGTKVIDTMKPALSVSKTSDAPEGMLLKEGDVVNYTVVVKNTGNVTVTGIKVADNLAGAQLIEGSDGPISLAPGSQAMYKYRYTVTQQDVLNGHIENIATATGTDPKDGEVENSGSTDDPTEKAEPSLYVGKRIAKINGEDVDSSQAIDPVKAGDVITYKLTIVNNGNVDLSDAAISDELTQLADQQVGDLAKGASQEVETSYTVTEQDVVNGKVANVATGVANAPTKEGDVSKIEATSNEVVADTEAMNPALFVEKTAANGVYGAGDEISYTITVTNTGNVKLSNVNVVDAKTGLDETVDIAAGDSVSFTTSYTVTDADIEAGELENTATAKGADPKGGEVTSEDTEVISHEPQVDPANPDKPSLKRSFDAENPADVTYNGAAQKEKPLVRDKTTNAILTEGVDYDLSYSNDVTNAGAVTVTVIGKGNYEGSIDCSYEILPATLVVTTGSAEKTFDGAALTSVELSITGLKGSDSVSARTTGQQTEVGSSQNGYSINWLATLSDNYVIVEHLGTLTVNPAAAPVPDNPTPTNPSVPDNSGSTTPTPAAPAADGSVAANDGGPVGAIAQVLQDGYEAMTGDVEPAAEEQIFDEENPLGKAATPSCWVHFYMIILMIITAVYGLFVALRRGNHTRRLKDDMNDMLDGGTKAPDVSVATGKPVTEA